MKYDINVLGCQQIIVDTATDAEPMGTALTGMGRDAQGAAQTSRSALVADALAGYFEKSFSKNLKAVSDLTANGLTKLNEALTEFQQGDEAMVHRAVTSMSSTGGAAQDAPGPGRGGRPQMDNRKEG